MLNLVLLSCGQYEDAQPTCLPMVVDGASSLTKEDFQNSFIRDFFSCCNDIYGTRDKTKKQICDKCSSVIKDSPYIEHEKLTERNKEMLQKFVWAYTLDDIDYSIQERLRKYGWKFYSGGHVDRVICLYGIDSHIPGE
jgi:hypothetical protein